MIPVSKNSSPCSPVSSNCVIWQGPNIPCINLCNGDTVSDVIGKLAEELCNILDQSVAYNPDLSGLDLSCLPESTPLELQPVLQAIIDYTCSLVPGGGGTSLPNITLPDCLRYNDPLGNPVTQLPLDQYSQLIGNKICDILDSIKTIQAVIADHETRLVVLENCVLPCTGITTEKTIVSSCMFPGQSTAVSQVVLALETEFCSFRGVVGTIALINSAIAKQCIPGTAELLSTTGTYSSLVGWQNSPATLAESVGNLWLVICDMHEAVKNIQLNCCPTACDATTFGFTTSLINNTVGVPEYLNLNFTTSVIPASFNDCSGGTQVLITDSLGGSTSTTVNVASLQSSSAGINVPISSLNVYSNLTVTVDFCATDGKNTCNEKQTSTVNLTIPCPPNITTKNITENSVDVEFTNNIGVTATYTVKVIDLSTGVTAASTVVNNPGTTVTASLTGLAAGTTYYPQVVCEINRGSKTCNGASFETSSVVSCDNGIDIAVIMDYTGSMGSTINAAKTGAASLVSTAMSIVGTNDYRLGLVIVDETANTGTTSYNSNTIYTSLPSNQKYVDTMSSTNSDIYITAMEMFSANNGTSYTTQLSYLNNPSAGLPLGYGNGGPEPMDVGLDLVVNSNFLGAFRSGVAKYAIIITDASPSGTDDTYSGLDDTAVAALANQCLAAGVKVIVLGSAATLPVYQNLAAVTGGTTNTSFDSSTIATQIQNNCGTSGSGNGTPSTCTEYTAATTSGTGVTVTYIECDGVTQNSVTIGGASGFDATIFCASSIVSDMGAMITINGDCPT
ncbi:MAG: hypothetical protein E6R13_07655 [Spirochaetes bacterium]|nr:MAG: hypothetical protein E6R13_07655 [Spirochaetota bacterium]